MQGRVHRGLFIEYGVYTGTNRVKPRNVPTPVRSATARGILEAMGERLAPYPPMQYCSWGTVLVVSPHSWQSSAWTRESHHIAATVQIDQSSCFVQQSFDKTPWMVAGEKDER